ncbi:MAG TPA: POTRA domain-containing protein [Cyclobacteriaceae bacterium]|nr:POTRA domain-containing protein [Cyclobacteriaceae bacterium]
MLAIILTFAGLLSTWQEKGTSENPFFRKNQTDSTFAPDSSTRFVQINRIFIIGNRLTRDHIILRELSMKSGDTISTMELDARIEKDRKKIYNTRLFNTVEIRKLEIDKDKIDLLIDLNERWYTFPSPIFELSDRNFNEWWQNYDHDLSRVNYGLRLSQFNVRGRNETLLATMQFGFNRVFSIRYSIPYIDHKQKQGLNVDFYFLESKNLAFQTLDHKLDYYKSKRLLRETRGASVTYSYRNSFYESHAVKLEYEQINVDDTIPKLNPNYLGSEVVNQKFMRFSYHFFSDHRDVIAYPLKGYHFRLSLFQSGFGLDVKKTEIIASYSRFIDLKKNFYLSNYTYGYWSSPQDQSYNQYGVMGFRKEVLRGYEVYVVEGPYFFINKTTLKKRIFSQIYRWENGPVAQFRYFPLSIYIKTYADVGYVQNYPYYEQNNFNNILSDKLLVGAGAGIDIVTAYDMVFRLEYSFNGEGQSGFFLNVKKEF